MNVFTCKLKASASTRQKLQMIGEKVVVDEFPNLNDYNSIKGSYGDQRMYNSMNGLPGGLRLIAELPVCKVCEVISPTFLICQL